MTINVGSMDRAIRVLPGSARWCLTVPLEGDGRRCRLIGSVPLFATFAGWCPLHAPLGANTGARLR